MISGKDVRIENGYIIINGEKHPIVQDVSEIEEELETKASKTYVDDFLKIQYVSTEISSIAANASTDVTIPLTIHEGYIPIGCLQFLTSKTSVAITAAYIYTNDNTLRLVCANLYSTDLSNVTVAATVGYIRSNT